MKIGICKVCSGKFTYSPSNKSGKYCSSKCYHNFFRGRNHPKYKEKVKIFCEECGKMMIVTPSAVKIRRFCSKTCRQLYDSKHSLREDNPNWKGGSTERICLYCGQTYVDFRWKHRKYCSRSCASKMQGVARQIHYICANCGKKFRAKRKKRLKYYCSRKCAGQSHRGKNNPFYGKSLPKERVAMIIKAFHARPNRAEYRLIKLMEDNHLPFHYVGNGKLIIGGKNPDFVHSQGEKKVVELFGDYWHSPLRRPKMRPTMTYDAIKKHYIKYGYDVLILWEGELRKINRT